jgi:hypothetical protein
MKMKINLFEELVSRNSRRGTHIKELSLRNSRRGARVEEHSSGSVVNMKVGSESGFEHEIEAGIEAETLALRNSL